MSHVESSTPLLSKARVLDDLLGFERYVVVGANSGGDQVSAWLTGHGKSVIAFTDLDAKLCGTIRAGFDVLPLPNLRPMLDDETAFVIGTVRQRQAASLLVSEIGVPAERVFPFVNPMFASHYEAGVQNELATSLARVRELLADGDSRAYFDRVTSFYRTLDSRFLSANPSCIGHYGYRAPGANPKPGAQIADCGAFVGDTFDDFLRATDGDCHIYALEAFLPNLKRLISAIDQRNLAQTVTPLHIAAARERGMLMISGNDQIADGGATSASAAGAHRDIVLAETLDALFLDHLPRRIDYLKMDIEGADLDALIGGRRLLQEQRPVVAVAAYHHPRHIVEIAEFLSETLAPCRIYAGHDPAWVFHIHYVAVPNERACTTEVGR